MIIFSHQRTPRGRRLAVAGGIVIQLKVQHNYELEKEILSFGEGLIVLEPEKLRQIIKRRIKEAMTGYEQ